MIEGKRRGASRALKGGAAIGTICLACSVLDNLDDLSSGPLGQGGDEPSAGAAGASAGGSAEAGAGGFGAGTSGSGGLAGSDAGGSGSVAGASGSGGLAGSDAGGSGATRLYWLERGSKTVNAANMDGGQPAPLITLSGAAGSGMTGIAVDALGSGIYFTDSQRKRVQRINLDGSSLLNLMPGIEAPSGIDLDPSTGKFYVALQGSAPGVQRVNLDGASPEPLITTGLQHPVGLALDVAGGKLYFVDDNLDAIFCAALDGSNLTNLNIAGVDGPIDISLDTLEHKIYWSELGAPGARIRRANLDGSGVEDIVTPSTAPGFSTPQGLEVDVAGRALYFVDGGANGSILRAQLDGSGPAPVLTSLNEPTGLTIR